MFNLTTIIRTGDWVDVVLMVMGTVGAVGDGCSVNCLLLFASGVMNSLGYGKAHSNGSLDHAYFMKEVEKYCLYFVYLGLAVLLVAFLEGYCWSKTSERQVVRIRHKYLEAILRQEVAFFDSQEATTAEIINSISKNTCLIQEVLSEKVVGGGIGSGIKNYISGDSNIAAQSKLKNMSAGDIIGMLMELLQKVELHPWIQKQKYITFLLVDFIGKFGLIVFVEKVELIRPNEEMLFLEDVIGSTIAWASMFIVLSD